MSYSVNIHGKKLREVGQMFFNGGLVKLIFGNSYDDQFEICWYTGTPEAAHELFELLNTWKTKHCPSYSDTQPTPATNE